VEYRLDRPFPTNCVIYPPKQMIDPRNKRISQDAEHISENASEGPECILCTRYQSVIYMDFVDKQELVVVEQPWLSVAAGFPAPLRRHMYGT
jgi:hypothetical protein